MRQQWRASGGHVGEDDETMSTTTKARASYHHGELPEVLMDLALKHIEAEGTQKLSMRALSREAGVSQTAPYRHFPTTRCLLAAIATRGFEELDERIAAARHRDAPLAERFIDMGVAYVEFAVTNPTKYHLMFGAVLGDFSDYAMLREASTHCYGELLGVQRELIAALGREDELDLDQLGGAVWATVHGIASTLINFQGRDHVEIPTMRAVAKVRSDVRGTLELLHGPLVAPLRE